MKLTRLRLIGFKSFVEPTDFAIEPGLTGVVGPNGCGKSNLVEAVRWVMGEASYKAMRAAEMDDVIFSGNTDRPSRNHAEVSVLVDNDDRKAPATFNDSETLEVSRRIMREQGSVFRVNGREVRARDVAMLFADASTGSRSPALVHQGRVGEIIQARPDQRRRVLEEAAGISGLHARRHEAELRLKAAEHNLARVEDVIGQLAAQVASLKTQARQAVRYRNISHQVRRIEALLLHLRWVAARTELGDAERTNDEAVRVVAARTGEQAQASTRQAGLAAGLPALREAEAKAAAALQRLLMAREALEREEARAKEQIEMAFAAAGLAVPTVKEVLSKLPVEAKRAEKILQILLRDKSLVRVTPELIFHRDALAQLRGSLSAFKKTKGERISVPVFKELTGITRKYAIPLLEYLDRERVTRRAGDERVIL